MTEKEEDTVAYDDKVPLEDAGDVPMVGATSKNEVDVLTNAPAPTEETKAHNWTAFNDLPVAGGTASEKGGAVKATEAPENEEPKPLTAPVTASGNDTEHRWTGVDKLPVAGEGTMELDAPAPPAVITTVADSGENQSLVAHEPPATFTSMKFDTSRLVLEMPEQVNASIPFEDRHQTIFGYNATMAYLQLYTKSPDSKEQLFLFFTCSDDKGNRDDWTRIAPQLARRYMLRLPSHLPRTGS